MTIINFKKGSGTMRELNCFRQQNHSFVVYPVWSLQWGLFADGKILHCESSEFLSEAGLAR